LGPDVAVEAIALPVDAPAAPVDGL
jgi:hypothetical protein